MYTLPKSERLSSERAIKSLFESGQGDFVYPFRYIFAVVEQAESAGGVKVVVSVSKRNHKRAVVRNLIKRRTREAYRLHKAPLLAAYGATELHLALVYASKKVEEYQVIEAAVQKILGKLRAHR